MLLAVVHFWWFELGLGRLGAWSFGVYRFVIAYAALHFFTVALLVEAWRGVREFGLDTG